MIKYTEYKAIELFQFILNCNYINIREKHLTVLCLLCSKVCINA